MTPRFISTAISTATAKPRLLFLVKNKESGKMGIAICHGGKDECFFAGAGTTVGNGDDFSWMDTWFMRRRARRPSSSARLYWLKERIRRRIDLLERKKLLVATARRLSSRSSGKALAATGPGFDKPTIT
jgi:hypothetical protein